MFRDGRAGPAAAPGLPGGGSVAAARDAFAEVLARAPWIERWPARLAGVRLGRLPASGGAVAFAAGDATGCLPLRADPRLPSLLAVAGGRPVDLFGLHDGHGLSPLALATGGRLYAMPAQASQAVLLQVA